MTSYPTPAYRRTALAPAILGALCCLAGVALVGGDAFTIIRFAVSIIALIVAWFAVQARHWWWPPLFVVVALALNPVIPVELESDTWLAVLYVSSALFIAAGLLIKIRNPDDRNQRSSR